MVFVFLIGFLGGAAFAAEQPRPAGLEGEVVLTRLKPVKVNADGKKITIDYGKVFFSQVTLSPNSENFGNTVKIKLRESGQPDPLPSIGQEQIGVRYLEQEVSLVNGAQRLSLPDSDKRLMHANVGAVMPFRYLDIYGWKGEFSEDMVDVEAARSSKYRQQGGTLFSGGGHAEELNRLLELSNHTIEATSFAGVFVDGDRERLPYEADAYINMLGWFANVDDVTVPRRTFDFLVEHPSWPTEWQAHMIFMAWADYQYTGDLQFLRKNYEWLKLVSLDRAISSKTGMVNIKDISWFLKRELKVTYPLADIVDWPPSQRDGHEMKPSNTVTNAFVYMGFVRMADIAHALGEDSDRDKFTKLAAQLKASMDDRVRRSDGLYVDGIGSSHTSAHSLFVPLAFGMVNADQRGGVLKALSEKIDGYSGGFPCSVFMAQYLLEALFQSGEDEEALSLMLNKTDRGWFNMIRRYDATITHEAWDVKFKDNEDWTHAWGAAPSNIIPRFILGVNPVTPGWAVWTVKPSKVLKFSAESSIPTPYGVIKIIYDYPARKISFAVPAGTVARLKIDDAQVDFGPGQHQIDWKL
ncbi:alpha-L-rhamnosidase C-terminal domain-containing protein [Pseudomonas vanderleydeniana]|nr:alpha-L-rhamnosidase C-terminal domain-containing protein [Pseudomonas vanderleydeniana]